jgi:hypothetical protein
MVLDYLWEGANIQATQNNGKYSYDLILDGDDIMPLKATTFNRLMAEGLIRLKHRPLLEVEIWGIGS